MSPKAGVGLRQGTGNGNVLFGRDLEARRHGTGDRSPWGRQLEGQGERAGERLESKARKSQRGHILKSSCARSWDALGSREPWRLGSVGGTGCAGRRWRMTVEEGNRSCPEVPNESTVISSPRCPPAPTITSRCPGRFEQHPCCGHMCAVTLCSH